MDEYMSDVDEGVRCLGWLVFFFFFALLFSLNPPFPMKVFYDHSNASMHYNFLKNSGSF